jgi:hypothetical protein
MKRSLAFLPLMVLSTCLFGCGDGPVVSPEQAMNMGATFRIVAL